MTTPKDGPGSPHHSAEAEWVELQAALSGYLKGLLIRTFEVPERDAEWMVRERFRDYILNRPAPNARAWLIGAVCREANDYRRRRGLPAANEAEIADIERRADTRLSIRDAMAILPSHAREALRLRFDEKKTYAEIAAQLGLSVYATERFVTKALAKLRGLLRDGQTRHP